MGQKRDKAAAAQAAAKRAASKPQPVNYVAWVGAVVIGVLAFELAGLRPWLLGGDAGASTTPARTPSERGQRLASEDLSEDDVAAHVERVRKAESVALPCENESPDCVNWAQSGECEKNSGYMHKACRPACGLCTAPPGSPSAAPACADTHRMCATWASIGECGTNPSFMNSSCRVACRLCQSEACSDKRDDCEELSRGGGCYTRPRMREECAWSCVSCDVSNETQCTRDRSRPAAAVKGSVERMFELIRAAGGAAGAEAGGEGAAAEDAEAVARVRAALAGGKVHVHSTDPWVLTIDDFLSSKDADAVLAAGSDNWSRSLAGDGEQAVRTSSTSWCRRRCLRDATVIDVQNRVERLTGVPTENAEFMQALRCALDARAAAWCRARRALGAVGTAQKMVAVAASARALACGVMGLLSMTCAPTLRARTPRRSRCRYEPGQFYKTHHVRAARCRGPRVSARRARKRHQEYKGCAVRTCCLSLRAMRASVPLRLRTGCLRPATSHGTRPLVARPCPAPAMVP